MTFLRGSNNYVWCTTSVLGKGATGAVFQGVNKHNGEPVAVKTFNQLSHMRPQQVQMREFDVLRKVNHQNIVKLLAVEEEQEGRGKVIIMELCTGGSLFNMLDDPENAYGLNEREFFLVLRHLSDGMKHLRDLNLVHRDLKPGNIMKYIDIDGSTIYKLTDFGAARELDDDQQFMSLYGTEEYLHPDMYERAVLRKSAGKSFRATVDLWSIGVTLYHVATGQLPFRPYGGRKNKETMHNITTKKKPGIISGIQTTEGGEIQWSQNLPDTCQLSLGAKHLVTPLLAGLLEVDQRYMWSFERFFDQVTLMTSRLVVPVFYVNTLSALTLYLKPTDQYEAVSRAVQQQTGIPATGQILLLPDGRQLLHCVTVTTPLARYPPAAASTSATATGGGGGGGGLSRDQPLLLFDKQNNDVAPLPALPLPKFPNISQTLSVENDAVLAKMTCSVAHELCRRVAFSCRARSLMDQAVHALSALLTSHLNRIVRSLAACQKLSSVLDRQLSLLCSSYEFTRSLMSTADQSTSTAHALALSSQLRTLNELYRRVSEQQSDLADSSLPELQRRLATPPPPAAAAAAAAGGGANAPFLASNRPSSPVPPSQSSCSATAASATCSPHSAGEESGGGGGGGVLVDDWSRRCCAALPPLTQVVRAPACAATYTAKIRDSWQHLLRDRTARNLTFNDEQFHHLEKIKLAETSSCLQRLLQQQVLPDHGTAAELLSDWYKVAQTRHIKLDIAGDDISRLETQLEQLAVQTSSAQQLYTDSLAAQQLLQQNNNNNSSSSGANNSNNNNNSGDAPENNTSVQLTLDRLDELETAVACVWRELQQNASLTSQLQTLTDRIAQSNSSVH